MIVESEKQLQPPELLPCPLDHPVQYGVHLDAQEDRNNARYANWFIRCGDCGLELDSDIRSYQDSKELIDKWNTRTRALVPSGGETDDNAAAIALLDKWLAEPMQEDDGSLDRLRWLIDANRLSDRKFWPELSGGVATVDQMWEALKAACCKNPAEAKLAVFVSEKKFKDALAPFAAIVKETNGNNT